MSRAISKELKCKVIFKSNGQITKSAHSYVFYNIIAKITSKVFVKQIIEKRVAMGLPVEVTFIKAFFDS